MGTRNGCHLCPTCGTQLGQGDLCCTLPVLGLGFPPLQEAFGLQADAGRLQRAQQDMLFVLQGTPWWAAKHQPRAHALSAGNALKTENCFQPQEK